MSWLLLDFLACTFRLPASLHSPLVIMPPDAREALPMARWTRDDLDQHSECTRLSVRYAPPLVDEDPEARTARRHASSKVLSRARKRHRTVAAARQAKEDLLAKKRGIMDAQQHARQEAKAALKAEEEAKAERKAAANTARRAEEEAKAEHAPARALPHGRGRPPRSARRAPRRPEGAQRAILAFMRAQEHAGSYRRSASLHLPYNRCTAPVSTRNTSELAPGVMLRDVTGSVPPGCNRQASSPRARVVVEVVP